MVAAGRTRIVSTGTYWQHYENKDYSPVCLYAACKEAFEKILQYYVEAFGIQAITLVLFDTYGASDRRGKLFSLLYEAAVSRTPLDMTPGEQLVDLVHVDDVANAYRVAAERLMTAHGTVNDTFAIGSGSPLRLRDLVAIYSDVTGLDVPIRWGGRAYRQREVMSPWSRGHRLPGWTSKIDMGRGLRDLYHTISKRQV